jgi:hypothetical protein
MTQNLVKGHKVPVDKGLSALGPPRAQTHYLFTLFIHSHPPGLGPVPKHTIHIIFTHIPLIQCQIVCVTDNECHQPLVLDLNAWCTLQKPTISMAIISCILLVIALANTCISQ